MKYCNAQNALCKCLLILRAWNATRLLKPRGKGYNSDHTVLIRFPIIAPRSKGAHYFHRVVGLVVLSMSVAST